MLIVLFSRARTARGVLRARQNVCRQVFWTQQAHTTTCCNLRKTLAGRCFVNIKHFACRHHNGFCSLKNRVWRTPAFKRAHGSLICACFYVEKPLSKTKGSILCVFYDSFCTLAAMMQCYRIKHQFHASETVTNPAAKNG